MIRPTQIFGRHRDSGALNAMLNIGGALDENAFVTKSGDVMMALAVHGLDEECQDSSRVDQTARGFESAARTLGEDIRVHQFLIKRDHAPIPFGHYDNPVVQQSIDNRIAHFQSNAAHIYSLDVYFVFVYEDPRTGAAGLLKSPSGWRAWFSAAHRSAAVAQEMERAREMLSNKVAHFVAQLPDVLRVEVLDKDRIFRFLRRLVNYASHKAEVGLKYDDFVDYQLCGSELECHRDHLRLDDFFVSVLTLKEAPARTFACVLRGLQMVPCNLIVTSEWKPESNAKMLRQIHSKRRHFHNSKSSLMNYVSASPQTQPRDMLINNAAVAQVDDLGACLEELEFRGRSFGQFSMTLVLFDEDRTRLKHAVAGCFRVFSSQDAQLTEERYNLLNAWLATIPGNSAYNLRRLWLLENNYADLSFLFTPDSGEVRNAHLGGAEYLAVLESNHGTPYFLNLHCGDVAHTIILGSTGSGKSFLVNYLLTHAQKYAPFTCLFDLGGGYQSLTQLFGGTYLPVGIEKRGFTINPFTLAPTKENLHFLFSFLRVLIEPSIGLLTPEEERDLYEQIESLYIVDADQRRLLTLSNMLGRRLRAPLQKWVEGGPYAALFDNAEDNLTFARFQTFDFEGMDKAPQLLEPLLFYILHRATTSIYDVSQTTALKFFVIDEAWRFLRHPTIRQYILEALKTWRKKNAAMILATQSSDDLVRSEMLSAVVESCPTKMFLANPDIDQQAYRELFHLNETEAALIPRLTPKRQILIKRPNTAKVVNLNVGPKDYWLYTSNPYDRERRREAFERYGFEQGLEILSRSPSS